jgi:hypothetical protein
MTFEKFNRPYKLGRFNSDFSPNSSLSLSPPRGLVCKAKLLAIFLNATDIIPNFYIILKSKAFLST